MHFLEWKLQKSDSNFTESCSQGSNWQYRSIGLGNGLATNRRQAITWTNADPTHWHIHAAPGEDELPHQGVNNMGNILQMTFKCIFLKGTFAILIQISPKFLWDYWQLVNIGSGNGQWITNDYRNQWWFSSCIYRSIRLQCVDSSFSRPEWQLISS